MPKTTSDPHANAVTQLEQVAELLQDQYGDRPEQFLAAVERLKQPDRVLETTLEIKMDDGQSRSFKAFRSQHNDARGPYKGGIRYHQNVSKSEVMALSTWMTWKCAVTGIPYGGGKGGIIVDPKELSAGELERLSRAYARFVADHIGPWTDIPAPDVNTTGQIMTWMVDEYIKVRQAHDAVLPENPQATFTGKPVAWGGSQGREEATGLGGVYVLQRLTKALGYQRNQDVTVAIQGFGNVGYWFAHHADKLGYRVVAISDSKSGVYVEAGLDPVKTLECKKQNGSVADCICVDGVCSKDQGRVITNEELLELEVDILVPAALENVITADNASRLKAKAIIEMANGPVTPDADAVLAKRNIVVVPDVLANAGGVTTSYFEWVQNLQGYYWTHAEVLSKLQPLMEQSFDEMWQMSQKTSQPGRMATYMTAVKRVVDAMLLRGMV